LQSLINAIRATGSTNIIWAGPPWYSGNINMWLQMGLTDPTHELGATFHGYGYKGGFAAFQTVQAAGYPILATELGTLANIPSSYVQFRENGIGYTWWSGSGCGQWDNYCSQTPDQIAAVMANNPPWTNNGAPTRPDRIEVMGAGTPRPRVGTYHKAARACAVTGAQNGR
jgi:hypothetical protein